MASSLQRRVAWKFPEVRWKSLLVPRRNGRTGSRLVPHRCIAKFRSAFREEAKTDISLSGRVIPRVSPSACSNWVAFPCTDPVSVEPNGNANYCFVPPILGNVRFYERFLVEDTRSSSERKRERNGRGVFRGLSVKMEFLNR